MEQPFGPAVLSATRVAVTAPVVSALPNAVMHLPTTRAAFVADSVVVNVVAAVTVTVAGVVEPDVPDEPRAGSATAMLEPATDATDP